MSEKGIISGVWGVRYQVRDVSRSIEFYTKHLGFNLDMKVLPAFAQVSIEGELHRVCRRPV